MASLGKAILRRYDGFMKSAEYIEGPEAAARMDAALKTLLSIPREEMLKREAAYKAKVEAKPTRRGPKRKSGPLKAAR